MCKIIVLGHCVLCINLSSKIFVLFIICLENHVDIQSNKCMLFHKSSLNNSSYKSFKQRCIKNSKEKSTVAWIVNPY